MTAREREVEAKAITELEQKIVKVRYSDKVPTKPQGKIDTAKILNLAKKIRETYDYNDAALDGTH